MIIERIKALAEHKNLTFTAIERQAELGQGTIRKWNNSIPSGDKLLRVADLLGTTVDFLLTGKDQKGMIVSEQSESYEVNSPSEDEKRALVYYRRLNIENQDYIKGEMVRLIKEQDNVNSEGYKKGVAT